MRVGTKSAEQDTEMARPNRIKLSGEGYYHVIDRIAHMEFLLRDERTVVERVGTLYGRAGARPSRNGRDALRDTGIGRTYPIG